VCVYTSKDQDILRRATRVQPCFYICYVRHFISRVNTFCTEGHPAGLHNLHFVMDDFKEYDNLKRFKNCTEERKQKQRYFFSGNIWINLT